MKVVFLKITSVVDKEFSREIVRAVNDKIVLPYNFRYILCTCLCKERRELDIAKTEKLARTVDQGWG